MKSPNEGTYEVVHEMYNRGTRLCIALVRRTRRGKSTSFSELTVSSDKVQVSQSYSGEGDLGKGPLSDGLNGNIQIYNSHYQTGTKPYLN